MREVVDVWQVPASAVDPAAVAVLPEDEQARAAAASPAARPGFVAGRALLRAVLGDRLGVRPGDVVLDATCPVCGGPHGPVHVPGADVHVSLSRSSGLVAVALTRAGPVGVDVEAVPAVRPALAALALAPDEQRAYARVPPGLRRGALARAWVRKEAVLKAVGTGLRVAPADVVVHRGAAGFRATVAGSAGPGGVVAVGADVGRHRWVWHGWVGAVAVVAGPGCDGRVVVRRHDGAAVLRGVSGR